MSAIVEPNLVVALDIGSTYSGYAWQTRSEFLDRSHINFNTNWGTGSIQLHKTTTCVLLKVDKERDDVRLDSFGHEAEKQYSKICLQNDRQQDEWFCFKHFKLYLYNEGFREDVPVEDCRAQHLPLMCVMSEFIKALMEHCIQTLGKRQRTVKMDETLWVITVPAIWSYKAKKFMRDAAIKSGIHRKHLVLAHEPESAALYCMHLPSEEKREMNNFGGAGDKFIVADLGGGTLDMIAIEVLKNGKLKEMCAGTGSLIGGQDVNDAFFQSCTDAIEGVDWHALCSTHPEELLAMETEFENRKVQIGSGDERDEFINVTLPHTIGKFKIKERIDERISKYFRIENGKLLYNSALVRQLLFDETIMKVLDTLRKFIGKERLNTIKTLVLVGGFAESHIVVGNIETLLSKEYPSMRAVVPNLPFRAVLSGAVLFGHDRQIFQSRISRATFGVRVNSRFDPKKHDADKKWRNKDTGNEYCKDIFSIHVRKDCSVKVNEKQPSMIYKPKFKAQNEMPVEIYMSTEKEPKYTTDDGCKQIGTINVDISKTPGGLDRKLKVEMSYGGTELCVRATNIRSGKEYPAYIRFDAF